MKNIAFALLVFGIPFLFPVYIVVELGRGVTKTKNRTVIDGNFKEDIDPLLLVSQKQTETSFPFLNYPDNTDASRKNDLPKGILNTRHKHFK